MEAERRSARIPRNRAPIGAAVEGHHEALVAAPRITHPEQLEPVQHGADRLAWSGFQDDGEEAGRAFEIALPDRVTGMALQRRMQHPRNLAPGFEPARHVE